MTGTDKQRKRTEHSTLEAVQAIATVVMFVAAIAAALVGAYLGHLLALLLIPISWIITAFDPQIGRWRHVWE